MTTPFAAARPPAHVPSPSTLLDPAPIGAGQPSAAFPARFRALFNGFATLPLAQLDAGNLQNRVDTKFIFTEDQLVDVLDRIHSHYLVIDAFGFTYGRYGTAYYDTPRLSMYLDHHNGKRARFKVRVRTYLDTAAEYLEIKCKTNKERTVKTRLPVPFGAPLGAEAAGFVAECSPYALGDLEQGLVNDFWRISLVTHDQDERITLDLGLRLRLHGRSTALHGLVIGEVKQPKFTMRSPFVQEMRRLHLEPFGLSKYCIGIALLQPGVKRNAFKPRLLQLCKLLASSGLPDVTEGDHARPCY